MYSVLYVDDEPSLLEIGQIYLQKYWNLSVTTVSSAQEALDQLKITRYDIIVSDYQMPEMDGIEFLKTLRQNQITDPFILFTGRGREEIVIDALNNGADFYLQKGGNPKSQFAELVNMIQKAVEKRRAELEVHRVNHQSRAIINHLPDPTFVIDDQGIIISWNKALSEVTGIEESDIIGKSLSDCSLSQFGIPRLSLADYVLNPEVRIGKWYDNISMEGNTITAETWLTFGSREKRRIWVKVSPLLGDDDAVIGAIETLRDITPIRQNEQELIQKTQELHESGKRMEDIINFIPDPTFAIDTNGRVIAWNRAIERLTGTQASAILGEGNHAYSVPFYNRRRPTLIDLALSENPDLRLQYTITTNEHRHLTAEIYNDLINDGQGAHLWATVAPLVDSNGDVTGAIESIRDISDYKALEGELNDRYEELASSYEEIAAQNEEIRTSFDELDKQRELLAKSELRFRSLIEHLPDGVLMHRDGKIFYANPMACQILKYPHPSGLVGQSPLDIVHSRCRDAISGRITSAASTENPFIEGLFIRHDGKPVPIEAAEITVPIDDTISTMLIFRDITRVVERKNALRQAQNKLKVLTSITRHDIKNEVATVMTILDLVSTGDIPEMEANLLKRAFNPCENIIKQLTTTLEYQTIGIQEPAWFNLRSLVMNAARVRQIERSMYSFEGVEAEVFADPLISKVLENLMDNSLRHGKNLTKISCSTEIISSDLLFVYEDDGGGVPGDDKKKIFEDGFGKNTGLGLFLITEILAMTGITICECGEFGRGVRFEMIIPREKWRLQSS